MRPQEKLMGLGVGNLSETELLAILINTGTQKNNALSLAQVLTKKVSSKELANLALPTLLAIPGIGQSKATRILASIELGKRIFSPNSLNSILIKSASDALNELRDLISKNQEQIVALYLNARGELLKKELVALGKVNTALIEPKEIFKVALAYPCTSIILAHNHPSGDPTPSSEDIEFTKKMHEASELMGIKLFDHLIVCKTSYFSFRENKEMKN